MTQEHKAEIARRNGAKSKGPRSAEGKLASSRNSLKHGRYASRALESALHRAVAAHEDKERFLFLVRRNLEHLGAASAMERDLAIALADTQWRFERWNAAETQVLNCERRDVEENHKDRLSEGEDSNYTVAERDARAVRWLACRGDFLRRLTAERTRLLRERALHLRFFRAMRNEFAPPRNSSKQTKERTRERTGDPAPVLEMPMAVTS